MQAALLSVKLKSLDSETSIKRAIANRYLKEIVNSKICLPKVGIERAHVWHLFVIRTADRDGLQEYLSSNNIQTVIHYPVPPHKQAAYKEWNELDFPITEKIHNEVLSLPLSAVLNVSEVDKVIEVLNAY